MQKENLELDRQLQQLHELEKDIDSKIAQAGAKAADASAEPNDSLAEEGKSESSAAKTSTDALEFGTCQLGPVSREAHVQSQRRKLSSPRRQLSAKMESKARVFGGNTSGRLPDAVDEKDFTSRDIQTPSKAASNETIDLRRSSKLQVVLDILEGRNLRKLEDGDGCISCVIQVGDQLFRTPPSTSGSFPDGSATYKLTVEEDDEIVVTIVDLNRPILNNVVGNVKIPIEMLMGSLIRQDTEDWCAERSLRSSFHALTDVGEILEVPISPFHGSKVADESSLPAPVLVLQYRLLQTYEEDEPQKSLKGDRTVAVGKQIISNKISVFDGTEDLTGRRLYLSVIMARHLTYRSSSAKFCNPYCKVRFGDRRVQTSTCMGSVDPEWCGEVFALEVASRKDQLHVQILDWDMLELDRIIGSVKVSVSQALRDTADCSRKTATPSKATSSSSVALPKQTFSSSTFNRTSNSSMSFNKNVSSSSAVSEMSDDAGSRPGYKLFNAAGTEVRSAEGAAAYVVLRVSLEPFNEELAGDSEKQAWDANGLVKVDRHEAQRAAPPPPSDILADGALLDVPRDHNTVEMGMPSAQGSIVVSVIGCTGLRSCSHFRATQNLRPFCILKLGDHVLTTPLGRDANDPYFGHECMFPWVQGYGEMSVAVRSRDCSEETMLGW